MKNYDYKKGRKKRETKLSNVTLAVNSPKQNIDLIDTCNVLLVFLV